MSIRLLLVLSGLILSSLLAIPNTYYVSPSGVATNNGASFDSAMDYSTALGLVVAGDSIVLQGGTYVVPYVAGQKNTIKFTQSGMEDSLIYMITLDSIQAVFNFSFYDTLWVQDSYGFSVTGSYWYFKGIDITHAGYQGAYVEGSYNTFVNCRFYRNQNTGLEINKGGSYTTVINCDAFQNFDPKKDGSMADGFGPKQTQGPGNKFIGCRAWENSDDGYDCFDSPEIVTFEYCWAFRNGINVFGVDVFAGNGNGFKVGGNYKVANNILTNCVAYGQPGKGFDQNNNAGGLTILNCTAYNNGYNYGLGNNVDTGQKHNLKNNISLNGPISISNAIQANNTWNTGFTVSAADFVSLDLREDTILRLGDGSIPETSLFRLDSLSLLVDAGVDAGLPFLGNAPDLGCFESSYSREPASIELSLAGNDFSIYPNPFNSATTIQFTLTEPSKIIIYIIDISGKLRTSVINGYYSDGTYSVKFEGSNLQPGSYLCIMQTNDKYLTQRIAVIR
ncbi:MAG: right-handed parallel beta-helix repeat-containing protein [Bacteroidales bacterium]|nr:right-handed parallel beta-helix repeat-containing protein [Bacteroidales bacterium]